MTLKQNAHRWYVPLEILVLKNLLPVAAGANGLILCLELIRSRLDLALASIAIVALLILTRWALPTALSGKSKLNLARLIALVCFVVSIWMFFVSELSIYSVWARLWGLLPSGVALVLLFSPRAVSWAAMTLDETELAEGLSRNRKVWPTYERALAHVLLVHACLIVLLPIIWIFDVAVSPGNLLGGTIGDAFSLEHFATMMGGSEFWLWTRNSLIVAIGTTIFGLALAVPSAYAFSRFDFKGRQPAMFAFIVVQMFPGAIILVPYFLVMKTLGLLNSSIGLIIAYSVTALPLCIWMLKGFFDAVPKELEEAAKLDGCSTLQIFVRIILPLSLPAVAVTGVFSFITAWNEFLLALVFNTSNDQFTLPVGLASLIPSDGQRWGDFAAASLLVSIPVVALFILFQKSLIEGLSSGAVKG